MPKLLRDFVCDHCGRMFERFIDVSKEIIDCECGKTAHRVISLPTISLDGTDDGFPGAYDKWARIREDRHRKLDSKKASER